MAGVAVDKPPWDDYLMAMACLVAMRSPDPSTKHGCVVVDEKHRILGLGYNGFPRGGKDIYPTTRPEKYPFMVHSEPNALLNCSIRPEGGSIYVTGIPCSSCMLLMVQAGITKIIYGQIGSAMVDNEAAQRTFMIAENHSIYMQEYTGNPANLFEETCEYLISKDWR